MLLEVVRHLTVLAETVDEIVSDAVVGNCRSLRQTRTLLHHLLLLLDLSEPGVFKCL